MMKLLFVPERLKKAVAFFARALWTRWYSPTSASAKSPIEDTNVSAVKAVAFEDDVDDLVSNSSDLQQDADTCH